MARVPVIPISFSAALQSACHASNSLTFNTNQIRHDEIIVLTMLSVVDSAGFIVSKRLIIRNGYISKARHFMRTINYMHWHSVEHWHFFSPERSLTFSSRSRERAELHLKLMLCLKLCSCHALCTLCAI